MSLGHKIPPWFLGNNFALLLCHSVIIPPLWAVRGCALSHPNTFFPDVLLSSRASIHSTLAEPLGVQAAGRGGLQGPALTAASAHARTRGHLLSPPAFCLVCWQRPVCCLPLQHWALDEMDGADQFFGASKTQGLTCPGPQPRLYPDGLRNTREGRDRPLCTYPSLPQARSCPPGLTPDNRGGARSRSMLGNTCSSGSKSSALWCQKPNDLRLASLLKGTCPLYPPFVIPSSATVKPMVGAADPQTPEFKAQCFNRCGIHKT